MKALTIFGFAIITAFIALMLLPLISIVRANQVELGILETRARLAPSEAVSQTERHFGILGGDELFSSLAYFRASALEHNLKITEFTAYEVDNFAVDVSETVIRATITGSFEDAVTYVSYLAGGVYNIRYLSFVSAETAVFDVLISIFHE